MRHIKPTPQHKAFRDELIAAIKKHSHLRPDEMLAVASYFVGQLVAMQDQRKFSPEAAMQIVASNIDAGNQYVIAELAGASGGST